MTTNKTNVVDMKPTKKASTKPKKTKAKTKAKTKSQPEVAKNAQPKKPLSPPNLLEDTMAKTTAQFDQITQEATALTDAMSKSYGIMAKGYENLVRTTMEISQTAAEKQAALAKEIMSCTSVNELADMQSKIAQTSFEDFMSGATKISEMSTKLLTESAAPMSEQMNKAMQKIKKAA